MISKRAKIWRQSSGAAFDFFDDARVLRREFASL
jgi:hypothetical protein